MVLKALGVVANKTVGGCVNSPYITVSVIWAVDTVTNRFICNDAKKMKNLKMTTATIKSIGGEATMIKGIGEISIILESDDGHRDTIQIYDAVYVPSSS